MSEAEQEIFAHLIQRLEYYIAEVKRYELRYGKLKDKTHAK